ncbi:hypothetical protein FPOA_13220 [Fusarium poae]|uniref:Uncharacterized protein n=1 Tax=Fusarium poae TaxID=36050 RepID=A0A1B8A6B2_FUSPO|nr:hypothetical protein FPOA_13220 [Fusarium poae]
MPFPREDLNKFLFIFNITTKVGHERYCEHSQFDASHEDEVDWAYETDADDVERGSSSLLGTTCLEGHPTLTSPLRSNPFARKRRRGEISEGSTDEQYSESEGEVIVKQQRKCSVPGKGQRRKVQYKTNVVLFMCEQCGEHELWEEFLRHVKAKATWVAIAGQRVATQDEEQFLENLGVLGSVFREADRRDSVRTRAMFSAVFRRNRGSEATFNKADTPTDNGVGGERQENLLVHSDPEMDSDGERSEVITTPEQGHLPAQVTRTHHEWDTSDSVSEGEQEEGTESEIIWSQDDDQQRSCHRSRDENVSEFHVELDERWYLVVSADDSDRGSPADVITPLLDFLPENKETRHVLLFHMLLAIIKHGGDDDGYLTRRLLLLDDSNVSQEIPRDWGFQGLCCRYGRLKQLRVFLGRGLNPWGKSMVDGVMCTTEHIVKQFSPDMLESFQRITDDADVLRSVCIKDPSILPMLGRMYPPLVSE